MSSFGPKTLQQWIADTKLVGALATLELTLGGPRACPHPHVQSAGLQPV